MVPTPMQCRAARAMLDITRDELSRRSGVSSGAIRGFEKGETKFMRLNHEAIRQTFEQAGIVFIGKVGVEFRGAEQE